MLHKIIHNFSLECSRYVLLLAWNRDRRRRRSWKRLQSQRSTGSLAAAQIGFIRGSSSAQERSGISEIQRYIRCIGNRSQRGAGCWLLLVTIEVGWAEERRVRRQVWCISRWFSSANWFHSGTLGHLSQRSTDPRSELGFSILSTHTVHWKFRLFVGKFMARQMGEIYWLTNSICRVSDAGLDRVYCSSKHSILFFWVFLLYKSFYRTKIYGFLNIYYGLCVL